MGRRVLFAISIRPKKPNRSPMRPDRRPSSFQGDMQIFHVHVSTHGPLPDAPYLILGTAENDTVCLDFSRLQSEGDAPFSTLALSSEAIYDVLEGKTLNVERSDGSVSICPSNEELWIEFNGIQGSWQYRVWMAEFALAWNMLCRTAQDGGKSDGAQS